MKRISKILLTVSLLAAPSAAFAHPGGGRDARPECVEKHKAKVARFDANRDGKLDEAERTQAKAAKKQEMLQKFDANRDGKLDDAERTAKMKVKTAEVFTATDTNRDNQLSQTEAAASCSPIGRHFGAIDADKSGFLTRAELEAARAHMKGKHGKRGHGDRKPPQ